MSDDHLSKTDELAEMLDVYREKKRRERDQLLFIVINVFTKRKGRDTI